MPDAIEKRGVVMGKQEGACECDTGDCGEVCDCDHDLRLEQARRQWEEDFQAELQRLQRRVAELEEQAKSHASRQICALMTEIDSLERNVLGRNVTISQLKKAGMSALGLDKGK